jgi:hypothetical protein
MKIVTKIFQWPVLFGLVVVVGTVVYFGAIETYIYFTRSEAKAQTAAQTMFLKICESEKLDPYSFHGPSRPSIQSDEKLGAYTFVWTRSPEETITVSITYFPYDLPYSVSEAIIEHKPGSLLKP